MSRCTRATKSKSERRQSGFGAGWSRASAGRSGTGNCSTFRYLDGQRGPDLAPDRSFEWRTFATRVRSVVRVFEPFRELGWDARSIGLYAFHGWMLEPAAVGCRVVTEETQRGLVPMLARWYLRRMLLRGHQGWLEDLRRMAESGDPPWSLH
jgi:hypothetical protein